MQAALRDAQGERDRQQALAVDRALFAEQMVAIVSHDLRNPLSVIRMSSHILAMSGLTPKQQLALARVVRSNDRATRLIADLLDFSRSRLGTGLHLEIERIDLHSLVGGAIDDLRVANPEHVIEHRKAGAGSFEGNGDRLVQLVANLVINAITYGQPDRPVVVTSAIEERHCSISVHNEGNPIPEALLPRMFDPMTRGALEAGSASSVGLGLFIVREIAKAHGGSVDAVSSDSAGTTFRVTLPRSERDPAA